MHVWVCLLWWLLYKTPCGFVTGLKRANLPIHLPLHRLFRVNRFEGSLGVRVCQFVADPVTLQPKHNGLLYRWERLHGEHLPYHTKEQKRSR